MSIWPVMIFGGLATFGIRFSFIWLFGRLHVSPALRRALHYVPPAVLSAIIFPQVFLHDAGVHLSLSNHRLVAGTVAVLVAWLTRKTLVTILAGMLVMVLMQFGAGT